MTIGKFSPVAVMIGLTAAMWMVISGKMELVQWVPFLSWALFYGAGAGKFSRVPKELIGLTGGLIAAVLVVYLAGPATEMFGDFGLPVLVFFAGTIIVLLELTNWFELAPAYFYSFAGFFAFLFGGFYKGMNAMNFELVLNFWVLLLIGAGLGVLTAFLKDRILDAMKVPEDQRQTVFDKEKK